MEFRHSKIGKVYTYLLQFIHSSSVSIHDKLPTEVELAKTLSVSRPTVSKAVKCLIQEDLIYRVHGVGTFVKHKHAQTTKTLNFGLLFPLIGEGEIFRPITEEIFNLSEKLDFHLLWGGQFNNEQPSSQQINQMINFYIENKVDGIIMAPDELTESCTEINKTVVNKINTAGIPLVLFDADYVEYPNRSKFDLVEVDNFLSSYRLARHYIAQGIERIDYLSYAFSSQAVPYRISGCQQALMDAGITPSAQWIHAGDPSNTEFVTQIVKKGARNFLCSNDSVAFKLIRSLSALGFSVPQEIRVVGFDNVGYAKFSNPSLTTVAQPCKKIAQVIVATLIGRLHDISHPSRRLSLDTELIIRESSILSK